MAYCGLFRQYVVCGSTSSSIETELANRYFSEPSLLSLLDCLCNFLLLVLIYTCTSMGASCKLFELCDSFIFGLEISKLACRFVAETCPKHAKRKEGRLSLSSARLASGFVNEI